MRRVALALVAVLAMAGFAGTASAGVKRHYSHAYYSAAARCGGKHVVGRNVREHGSTLSNGKHVGRAKYRQLTSRLDGLCRPLPKPVVVPQAPVAAQAPATSAAPTPSSASTGPSAGGYCGAYQFDAQTWQSVGGSGTACGASPEEQDRRAQMLMEQRGTNPWPNCGSTSLAEIRQCENGGRY